MTAVIKNTDIDELIQSMTPKELWAMSRHAKPIQVNWTEEEVEKSDKIYKIMDLTALDYADVECLLNEPLKARLGDIKIYCQAMNLNVLDFIQNLLA